MIFPMRKGPLYNVIKHGSNSSFFCWTKFFFWWWQHLYIWRIKEGKRLCKGFFSKCCTQKWRIPEVSSCQRIYPSKYVFKLWFKWRVVILLTSDLGNYFCNPVIALDCWSTLSLLFSCFVFRLHLAVPKDYSWLSTQTLSLLEMFSRSYGMLVIKPQLILCKYPIHYTISPAPVTCLFDSLTLFLMKLPHLLVSHG